MKRPFTSPDKCITITLSKPKENKMKILIAILITAITAIIVLTVIAINQPESVQSSQWIQQTQSIGISTQGKAGVKVHQNLCINPTIGQMEICF